MFSLNVIVVSNIVSLVRDKTNIDVRYNMTSEEDNRPDESKEEETPLSQIAKIVEKNGNTLLENLTTVFR